MVTFTKPRLSLFLMLLAASVATAAEVTPLSRQLGESMIWLASAPPGRQVYAVFRKAFNLAEEPQSATLHLFADSRYTLWINGRYLERGPCRFDPRAPTYDTLDAQPYLRAGSNVVVVLVHHFHDGKVAAGGSPLSGRMMRHEPGLTAVLDWRYASGSAGSMPTDHSWRGATRTRFLPTPTGDTDDNWASLPDRIDARRDPGDWTSVEFDDALWEPAAPVAGSLWGPLRPRGIPRLRETQVGPLTLLRHGSTNSNAQPLTPKPLNEALPLTLAAGEQLVVDAGQFVQAYSVVDFEASDGAELELEYGQNFLDTDRRLTGSYGRCNRYLARAGRQTYMGGDTFGFKYFVLRLRSGHARLLGVRVVSRVYPFDRLGSFQSRDPALGRIWTNCVRTIQACAEDAYVDCATRERVEWMADAYVVADRTTQVALAGPGPGGQVQYADARLLGSLLRHIGQSLQPDGRLKAHHPSDRWDIHGFIEDYSCLWVQALREYHDHTGDLELAREMWPAVTAQMRWFLDRRTTNGLVKAREFVYFGNPLVYKVCEGTTLNAYLYGALRDAAILAGRLGKPAEQLAYADAAAALRQAIDNHLWDEAAGTYAGSILDGKTTPPTAHAAVMALYFDVVPESRREAVRHWFLANYAKEDFSPYAHHFVLRELYHGDTAAADLAALQTIRQRWIPMLRGETGTVWEGFGPGENCHEAGAVPAYFLSAYVLGVRMEGPVDHRRLLIEPRLADLTEASGTVVTERGLVQVAWERSAVNQTLEWRVSVPAGVTASLRLPAPEGKTILVSDDQTLVENGHPLSGNVAVQGRWFSFDLGPGKHSGRVWVSP